MDTYGFDYGKATDTMKMSMTQATLERNKAVQSMSRLKQQLDQVERDKDQVCGGSRGARGEGQELSWITARAGQEEHFF